MRFAQFRTPGYTYKDNMKTKAFILWYQLGVGGILSFERFMVLDPGLGIRIHGIPNRLLNPKSQTLKPHTLNP